MAAFTTAAIVGAAVVGAAATVYSVNRQRKAAREQAARIDQQEREAKAQAKVVARERASLDAARDEGGADIRLGRGDGAAPTATGGAGAGAGAATSRTGSVGARVGGVGNQQAAGGMGQPGRASRRVGL